MSSPREVFDERINQGKSHMSTRVRADQHLFPTDVASRRIKGFDNGHPPVVEHATGPTRTSLTVSTRVQYGHDCLFRRGRLRAHIRLWLARLLGVVVAPTYIGMFETVYGVLFKSEEY